MNTEVTVTLTQDEANFIKEVLLNAPMQVNVKSMPALLAALVNGVNELAHRLDELEQKG